MKTALILVLILAVYAIRKWVLWKWKAYVFSAYIAENEDKVKPIDSDDINRLSKWVVQQWFKEKREYFK